MKKLLKLWWLVVPMCFIMGSALADYAATAGSGLNFASNVLGGTTHYMANMLCDLTVGKTQCATVDTSGNVHTCISNGVSCSGLNSNGPAAPSASSPVVLPRLVHKSTAALGTSLVQTSGPGDLVSYNCTAITGGAAGFCVAYNQATVPGTGALTGSLVLDFCSFDTTATGCSLAHVGGAVTYSAGIVILVTSNASPYFYTTGTDTAAISADSYQ